MTKTTENSHSNAPAKPSQESCSQRFIVRSKQEFLTFETRDNSLLEAVLAAQKLYTPPVTLPGSRFGPFRGPDDFATVPAPHLRVAFLLMRMTNTVVEGDGIAGMLAHWHGSSNAANEDINGPFALPTPAPGGVINIDHNNGIYQGLAIDACGLSISYPVTLDSWISPTTDVDAREYLARVSLHDADTLDQPGLYKFGYVITAESGSDVSDFAFSGLVSVFCKTDPDFD